MKEELIGLWKQYKYWYQEKAFKQGKPIDINSLDHFIWWLMNIHK